MTDHLLIVQVKTAQHGRPSSIFELSRSDLAGITSAERIKGYLALLDCAAPVSWVLVEFAVARQFLNRSVPIASLRAAQDEQMSTDCTDEFVDMIFSAKDRLSTLTFPLLARRAIKGNPI